MVKRTEIKNLIELKRTAIQADKAKRAADYKLKCQKCVNLLAPLWEHWLQLLTIIDEHGGCQPNPNRVKGTWVYDERFEKSGAPRDTPHISWHIPHRCSFTVTSYLTEGAGRGVIGTPVLKKGDQYSTINIGKLPTITQEEAEQRLINDVAHYLETNEAKESA